MQVISVVRNFEMYDKLVRNNPCYGEDTEFAVFDNNKENKNISTRYNEFLKKYDYSKEDWFVFCHEDWELKEDLLPKLETFDKNCLYGPIGMALGKWYKGAVLVGIIFQSHKNGASVIRFGDNFNTSNVGTFDCQCLIVHSSLIKNYHLLFDENLSFDLYVEDFCINVREKYNICAKVAPIKCQHYSYGANITERFYEQLKYLKQKYTNATNTYYSTVNAEVIADPLPLFVQRARPVIHKIMSFFYQKRITCSGKLLVKICKIPVYAKKENNDFFIC